MDCWHRGHRMGETPETEHKATPATLKGFLVQLTNYIAARKDAGTRLKNTEKDEYQLKILHHLKGLKVCIRQY